MLSILKTVNNSKSGESPSSVALKLNKWAPNVARTMSRLSRMGVLESERKGKMKLYSVPEPRRAEVKSIIEQAVVSGVSDAHSRLTESFYQNLLYTSLRNTIPPGWKVASNVKLKSGISTVNLDLTITDDTRRITGVELNMGPPGQHLYTLIGRAMVGISAKSFHMLIFVLLAAHVEDYGFLKEIRSAKSQPRFGVILREMPVESETTFAEGVAKEIIRIIRTQR